MRVLLLNGSTRKNGCTYAALSEAAKALQEEGIETKILQMGNGPVRDCIGCGHCDSRCPFHVGQVDRMQTIQAYFGE